jgi:hypothetical protein
MPSINDYRTNLQRAIAELRANRKAETTLILQDELALIKQRVIETGQTASGGYFKGYSDAVVPYWYYAYSIKNYEAKATPRKGYFAGFNPEKALERLYAKTGYWASYKEWREVTNRPIEFKNFSFTQEMWGGIEPLILANDKDSTTYEFGSLVKAVYDKINWNRARDGDFLKQSAGERELITKLNRQRVFKVLDKYDIV